MQNNEDWIENLFSPEEAEKIRARSERIEEDMTTVYEVTFIIPRDQAIELCRQYVAMHREEPSIEALEYVGSMLEKIIETLEDTLDYDGINPYEDDD